MNFDFKWINRFLICLILVRAMTILSGYVLWDDSYMFTRYADNLINYHQLAWNPGGPGTYGLTSVLYLLIVLPIRLIVGSNFVVTGLTSSIIGGLLLLALLVYMIKKVIPEEQGQPFLAIILTVLLASNFYNHFTSGMDTLFDLAYITLYIIVLSLYQNYQTSKLVVWVGLLGGLTFFIRPDLLLYSFIVPVALFLQTKDQKQRKDSLIIFLITVVVVGLQMLFADMVMNSPLPLPFFAKGTNLYGPTIYQHYADVPFDEFLTYLKDYWLLYLLSIAYFIVEVKNKKKLITLDFGLFVATILFTIYYLFFVLQIMYYNQRFYYPTLPVLIYLAGKGVYSLYYNVDWFKKIFAQFVVGALLVSAVIAGINISNDFQKLTNRNFWTIAWGVTDINQIYASDLQMTWYRLDEISKLPDDLVMATSEVGLLSAMNPGKEIIDLVGLNETSIARNGFSASGFFEEHQPDIIYLPHPHYKEMIDEIKNNQYFQRNYTLHSIEGALMEVAVKKQSKYYMDMEQVLSQ